MAKVTYLDDLQQMQADHIWGKARKMRKQVRHVGYKGVMMVDSVPYYAYRHKVAARFAGRAGRVAQQLIRMGDY